MLGNQQKNGTQIRIKMGPKQKKHDESIEETNWTNWFDQVNQIPIFSFTLIRSGLKSPKRDRLKSKCAKTLEKRNVPLKSH